MQETKAQLDKKDYIKLRNFYTAKEIINRMERYLTEWKKIFVNYLSDKGFEKIILKRIITNTQQI